MAVYMIWFLVAAVMIATLLTVGTLAAADLLPRRRPRPQVTSEPPTPARAVRAPRSDGDEHRRRPAA